MSNPLALAVMALLFERPMHAYEMVSLMRERAKHESVRLRYSSLYSVVAALEREGLISARAAFELGGRTFPSALKRRTVAWSTPRRVGFGRARLPPSRRLAWGSAGASPSHYNPSATLSFPALILLLVSGRTGMSAPRRSKSGMRIEVGQGQLFISPASPSHKLAATPATGGDRSNKRHGSQHI